MRTRSGSPAVQGIMSMTFFFVGWEECFHYAELSRWWWYHRKCAGRRLSNGTSLYRAAQCRAVVCLREKWFLEHYFVIPPSREATGRSAVHCFFSSCKEHSEVEHLWELGSSVAGTWFQGEGMGCTAWGWPVNSIQIRFYQKAILSGSCPKTRGKQDCRSLTGCRYLLLWGGPANSHSPQNLDPKWRNGHHMRYGELNDTWSFLYCSLKHCFTCVPRAQQVGRADKTRNENLDSQRNL